ncbi:MAG TPA: MBL fold metallo-hydrolase [Candidatus Hydrogenedentes bacterium]|nr:MBL fold metallo-hydrolase [Candidatus Hydrogenedentota bacterium]HPG67756.1 MBL fold metallo-hydrolase [Candidatus Hydrogenedentota bacterium]
MESLAAQINRARVPEGGVAVWWLAQAGFVFKTVSDAILYVDPYLSNVVEKAFGFKRLSLAPIAVADVQADWVLSSHEHLDHLDTDALPIIARNCPNCRFAGSQSCVPEYEKMGIPAARFTLLEPGARYSLGGVNVVTARSDHGELSPTALSLLLDFGKVRVLFTGDTALNVPLMQPLIDLKPDILLACINGRFGNLDGEEAAELTSIVSPRVVVPCHFWMFKEHNGDPEAFVQACARRCPSIPVRLLTPGEGLVCSEQAIEAIQSKP